MLVLRLSASLGANHLLTIFAGLLTDTVESSKAEQIDSVTGNS